MPFDRLASTRGAIAAHSRWARTQDRTAATARARASAHTALEQRLIAEYELDPGHPDFALRLEHARRAHFARLALASAKARSRKARSGR